MSKRGRVRSVAPYDRDERPIVRTVELDRPVRCYDEELKVLRFEEPTAGHVEAMDRQKGRVAGTHAMIAALCDVPIDAIRRLGIADYVKVQRVVAELMGPIDELDPDAAAEGAQEDDDEDPLAGPGRPSGGASA